MTTHYPPPPGHQPYPPQYGPPPNGYAPPPAPKKRKWPWIVGGIFGFIVLLGVVGGNSSNSTSSTPTTVAPTVVAAPATITAPAPAAAATVEQPAAPAGPATTFEDGTYEVGVDIAPGKYKTPGSEFCYWQRAKNDSGDFRSIIANEAGPGPKVVTVKAGEYFKTQGCDTWNKVG